MDSEGVSKHAREMLSFLALQSQFGWEVFAHERNQFLDDLKVSLKQLTAKIVIVKDQGPILRYNERRKLKIILSSAAWIFSDPTLGRIVACKDNKDIKLRIVDLFLEVKNSLPNEVYGRIFCNVVCPAYLPILQAIRKAEMILDEDLKCEVLSLWVYNEDEDGDGDENEEKEEDACYLVEVEFLQILMTLPKDRQRAVLEPWMTALLQPKFKSDGRYWEEWFEDWIREFLIKDATVRNGKLLP